MTISPNCFLIIQYLVQSLQTKIRNIMFTQALKSRLFRIIVTLTFLMSQALGSSAYAETNFFEMKEPPRAAEFIYRSSPKESLIGVQLLGAVKNPGLYYIPPQTDLLKLVTLAGGSEDADLSSVLVRKTDNSQQGVYEVDLQKLMKSTSDIKPFKLAQDDFVYIPKKEPWISNDVSRSITIISLITSIVLTSVLIERNSK